MPSTGGGASGRGRRVQAERAAGRHRRGGGRDRLGLGRAHDRDVDLLVAVELGAEPDGSLEPLRARLAHPHRVDAAGVGGRDLEQAVDARADDEQRVAGAQPGPVLGAQHAGERLDERGRQPGRGRPGARAARPTSSGMTRTRSANPPGSSRVARNRSHSVSWPRRQRRHSPHGVWWWIATRGRRAPGRSTPGADRADDSRSTSCPSTAGSRGAMYQSVTSEAHTPQARTSHTTSPGPGSGSGASSIRTSPGANDRATLIGVERDAQRVGVGRADDAALGDERGDQRRRRDVEGRVPAAACRSSVRRLAGGRADLVRVALLDRDVRAGRACSGRSSTWGRRPRTGFRPPARRAPGRTCRPCWRRRRWPPPGRSRRSRRRPRPPAISPAAAVSTISSCGIPSLASSYTVSRAPWSSGRDSVASTLFERAAVGQLGDHRERRPAAGRGERARVAVGEDPPGAGEQLGAVGGDRVARGLLLGVDRARLGERGGVRICRSLGARPRVHAIDRAGQVDRGRSGAAQELRGPVERVRRRVAAQLERDPVGARRRRSAARRGSPGDGSPRRRPRRCGARARARATGARSGRSPVARPSNRSATTLADGPGRGHGADPIRARASPVRTGSTVPRTPSGARPLQTILDLSGAASRVSGSGAGSVGASFSSPSACCSSPDSYISVTMSQPPTSSPSMNSCGIVGQFERAESSWRMRGSGRTLTAANG